MNSLWTKVGSEIYMCGIFGFVLLKPQGIVLALKVLSILETHQYPNEKNPVGGHGVGIYFLDVEGRESFIKVGKTNKSPTKLLAENFLETKLQARLFLGHVRWASPDFLNTVAFKECTQPYVAACSKHLRIISVHNGFVENYKERRAKLRLKHCFESEKKGVLIDSEVLPHYLEELLLGKVDVTEALSMLSSRLENQKGNTIGMLLFGEEKLGDCLVFIHHGRTRGLTIWSNSKGEILFSSRKEPIQQVIGEFLRKHNFKEKVSIGWKESKHLNPTIFSLPPSSTE